MAPPRKGIVRPGNLSGIGQSPRRAVRLTGKLPNNKTVTVLLPLTGRVEESPPAPLRSTVVRPGRIGLTRFTGQEPYEMTIPIRLGGGYPVRSVQADVIALHSLGEVPDGASEPPEIDVDGPIPNTHPNITWHILDFGTPATDQDGDGPITRYETTLRLQQHVTDTALSESLQKAGKGITNRKHRVNQGEDSLYDVALHEYGDPSKAGDIAAANPRGGVPMPLGTRLTRGTILRLP